MKVCQLCPTLCDPTDCTVHGIFQGGIQEWVASPLSRGSSQPRDQTQASHIAGGFFTSWAKYVLYMRYILFRASKVSLMIKNLLAKETKFLSVGWEDSLDEGMATHSSLLTWRIPWTEDPGGLQFNRVAKSRTRLTQLSTHTHPRWSEKSGSYTGDTTCKLRTYRNWCYFIRKLLCCNSKSSESLTIPERS